MNSSDNGAPASITAGDSSAAIQVRDLHKTYRQGLIFRKRVHALQGTTFEVPRGEIFGLLGPNGAGKTTMIKVLLGVVRKSAGDAYMLGRPAGDRIARRGVGYLPENHRIPRHHTGNTALEYYGRLAGMTYPEIRKRSIDLLGMVGLAEWGNVSVKNYSKGMQQRLGLAQALLHDPELLILDEPTDGVDPVGRAEMREMLRSLKDRRRTILINSHLLQEVELVCDHVAILHKGKLQQAGSIKDLTQNAQASLRIGVMGDEAALSAALSEFAVQQVKQNVPGQAQALVEVRDQANVDQIIDAVRSAGLSIIQLAPEKRTLEEAFVQIVHDAGTAPP
ncbi:MAG: ABC transporter ATP-binding protein [Pirellulales bacterium]|nr:ABC transporter ATP-binding protein [Pirellulales bacterium]